MKFRLCLLLVLFAAVIPDAVFCQSSIIAAKQKIYAAANDTERLAQLVAIGKLKNSLHGDTIYRYAKWAKQLALQLKDKRSLAWAEYSLISSDLAKGKIDSVVQKIESNAAFAGIKESDANLYYKVQLLKANALNRLNNRTGALSLQLKLLGEAEKEGNINAQLFALNFIGATYLNLGRLNDAKQIWLQGLRVISQHNHPDDREIEAYILSNVALIYYNEYFVAPAEKARDSFLITINRAIDLSEQNGYLGVLASSLPIRANFYGLVKNFEAGEKDFKQAIAVRKEVGDPFYIVNDLSSLCNFYITQKQYQKCIETAKEGIAMANRFGIMAEQLSLIAIMGFAYKSSGNFEQYSKTLEQYISAADSSNKVNASEKIAEIETKYEVQKKETLIAQQKLGLLKRNVLLFFGTLAIVMLLCFLAFRFKKYQRQQKIMVEEKKHQSELAVKEAKEKERKRIAADLHDNLGVQANAILHASSLLDISEKNKNVVADLQETAKEMLLNLRVTLWAMKTTDVSGADLWLRIISFTKQMGRHYTSLKFTVEGEPPQNMILPSNKALNVVLVVQETVNNAVKHAGATTIATSSSFANDEWIISIRDDGKGFDMQVAKDKKDAYGLTNMNERAAAGGFQYIIETAPGEGVKATICGLF